MITDKLRELELLLVKWSFDAIDRTETVEIGVEVGTVVRVNVGPEYVSIYKFPAGFGSYFTQESWQAGFHKNRDGRKFEWRVKTQRWVELK